MVNKKLLCFVIAIISLFGFSAVAQELNVQEMATTNAPEENWQYLEWEEENPEFVLYYKVVIEQFSTKAKAYKEINTLTTEDNVTRVQIRPYLQPGNYRFKVITYNLIGTEGVESDWSSFTIYKAFEPEVNNVTFAVNKTNTLYFEEINDGVLNISGRNLFDLKENEFDISFSEYFIERKGRNKHTGLDFSILEFDDKNRHLKVQFDLQDLEVGNFYFVARDASGLESERSGKNEFTVKYKKRFDLDVTLGYALPIVLFDNTVKEFFGTNIFPLSINANVTFIAMKTRLGYFGVALDGLYTRMNADLDYHTLSGNLFCAHLDFVYQKPIRVKVAGGNKTKHIMTLVAMGGIGITDFADFKYTYLNGYVTEPLNSINLSFNANLALQVYITSRLYAQAGCNFVVSLEKDMTLGFVAPSVSVGYQF